MRNTESPAPERIPEPAVSFVSSVSCGRTAFYRTSTKSPVAFTAGVVVVPANE